MKAYIIEDLYINETDRWLQHTLVSSFERVDMEIEIFNLRRIFHGIRILWRLREIEAKYALYSHGQFVCIVGEEYLHMHNHYAGIEIRQVP